MKSFSAADQLRVVNTLQRTAAAAPSMRISATWIAPRAGVDVSSAREILADAAQNGLLTHRIVAKCPSCGNEDDVIEWDDADESTCEAMGCDSDEAMVPYVLFDLAPPLLEVSRQMPPPKMPPTQPGTFFPALRRVLLRLLYSRVMS